MSHPCNNRCQSHCTSCVPSPCHHPQHGSPRLVNSSRPPRAPEVIGDLATSPRMWDLGEEHDPLFLSAFCILSWFANLCTPLLFDSATNEVVAQTFYFNFILERQYDHHCSDSNPDEERQPQRMKKQVHSTIAKCAGSVI